LDGGDDTDPGGLFVTEKERQERADGATASSAAFVNLCNFTGAKARP